MQSPYAIGRHEVNLPRTMNLRRHWSLAAVALLSLIYCIAELVPGRFAVTDEVFFKAAGRNWALTGHFAAPEILGRLTEGPPLSEIYFAQPPVYTFLFGVYTRLVGFTPRSCIAYDMLIHLLLIWSAVVLGRFMYGLDWNWAALCAVLLIPIGSVGRPDELAIICAMWAAIVFRSGLRDRLRVPIGGTLLGICVCTSLGAFVFLGTLVFLELLSAEQSIAKKMTNVCVATIISLAIVAACVLPILIAHPRAYQQLIEHAGEQSAILSAATSEERNSAAGLFDAWTTTLRYGYGYAVFIFGLLIFSVLCRCLDTFPVRRVYTRILASILSLAVLVVAMPGKYFYLLFQGCWLLIACVSLGCQVSKSLPSPRRRLLIICGTCFWLAASMPYLRSKLIMWTLPSDQSLTVNTNRLRVEIPAGAGVMTTDYWWALANRDKVYDALFSNPSINAIDYVVLSGNGSGKPGTPTDIRAKYKTGFVVIDNQLNHIPSHFFGFRLSRSSYGFGAYVLKNTSPSSPVRSE